MEQLRYKCGQQVSEQKSSRLLSESSSFPGHCYNFEDNIKHVSTEDIAANQKKESVPRRVVWTRHSS